MDREMLELRQFIHHIIETCDLIKLHPVLCSRKGRTTGNSAKETQMQSSISNTEGPLMALRSPTGSAEG